MAISTKHLFKMLFRAAKTNYPCRNIAGILEKQGKEHNADRLGYNRWNTKDFKGANSSSKCQLGFCCVVNLPVLLTQTIYEAWLEKFNNLSIQLLYSYKLIITSHFRMAEPLDCTARKRIDNNSVMTEKVILGQRITFGPAFFGDLILFF